MPRRSTTGLTATQFATLITALANHLTWLKPAEKPRRLALAHLFEGSQPTISWTIKTIEKALETILTPSIPTLEGDLTAPGSLVIDGTPIYSHLELALTREKKLLW